jgi:hypothetical protein
MAVITWQDVSEEDGKERNPVLALFSLKEIILLGTG